LAGILEHKWLKWRAILEVLKICHSGAGRNPVRRTFKIYGGLSPGLRRGDELFLSFLFDPKHDVSFCTFSMSKSKTIKKEKS
jgi:hypothetical protein